MASYTYQFETPGVLFSCISRGREADIGETVRIYLKEGKYVGVEFIDAKILTKTPKQVWDNEERRYREGYVYELEMDAEDLPAGVSLLDPCDIKEFGCPVDVNVTSEVIEIVTDAQIIPDPDGNDDCVVLQQTKESFLIFGQRTTDPAKVTTSKHCITHPDIPTIPYSPYHVFDPATT